MIAIASLLAGKKMQTFLIVGTLCLFVAAGGFFAGLKFSESSHKEDMLSVRKEMSDLNRSIISEQQKRHNEEAVALKQALRESLTKAAEAETKVRDIAVSFSRKAQNQQQIIEDIKNELQSDGNARPISSGIRMRLDRAADVANGDYGASERELPEPDSATSPGLQKGGA